MELRVYIDDVSGYVVDVMGFPVRSKRTCDQIYIPCESGYEASIMIDEFIEGFRLYERYGNNRSLSIAKQRHYISLKYW